MHDDVRAEVHAQAIRELVARDKNHPSVVLWSIANEPESDTEGAEAYFRPLFAPTRELDPSRPVGFVNVMLAPHGKCRVSQFADVLMLNRYYGWYTHTGDLAGAEQAWEQELRGWAGDGKPIIITEANNLSFSMTSFFLLIYYTDVVGSARPPPARCFW